MSDRLEQALRSLREHHAIEASPDLLARAFPDVEPKTSHAPTLLLISAALLAMLLLLPSDAEQPSSALGLARHSVDASAEWIELLKGGSR